MKNTCGGGHLDIPSRGPYLESAEFTAPVPREGNVGRIQEGNAGLVFGITGTSGFNLDLVVSWAAGFFHS
jgi:hypothetical protein